MKLKLRIISFILFSTLACSHQKKGLTPSVPQIIDGLYVNTYGNPTDPVAIFLHGGPGYDSQDFEITTAAKLAARNYFVVVFDQRGQGRSHVTLNRKEYSYQKYSDDIKLIIDTLKLKSPALIGHSHGGPIAVKFDQMYPGIISKIVLVSAPVNFWKIIESIKINCNKKYAASNNKELADKLNTSFDYLSGKANYEQQILSISNMFSMAWEKTCGLYTPAIRSPQSIELKKLMSAKKVQVPHENLVFPTGNFVVNEQYHRIDHSDWVRSHAQNTFGIYATEDGLFTKENREEIKSLLGGHYMEIESASHAIYLDQQDQFINAVVNFL